MSRRQSRVSLADRQNEALQEFETLKRRYLQYNKQIIKENSALRIQVDELKVQITQLYVENLALGKSNIALEKELKKAKALANFAPAKQNVLQVDAMAAGLITQLEGLRAGLAKAAQSPTPTPEPESQEPLPPRERQIVSQRFNLIAKAPEFDDIKEDEAEELFEASEPEVKPPRRTSTKRRAEEVPILPPPNSVTQRRPNRRQSGVLGPIKRPSHEEDEDEVDDLLAAPQPLAQTTELEIVQASEKPRSGRAKSTLASKYKGLKDVTNSPPKKQRKDSVTPSIMSVLGSGDDEDHNQPRSTFKPQPSFKPRSRTASVAVEKIDQLPLLERPVLSHDTEDQGNEGTGGIRSSRARKSVNYAEPKLNTKMRKPDDAPPLPYALPSLPLAEPNPAPRSARHSEIPRPTTPDVSTTSITGRPIKPLVIPSAASKAKTKPSARSSGPSTRVSEPLLSIPTAFKPPTAFNVSVQQDTGSPDTEDEEEEEEPSVAELDSDNDAFSPGRKIPKRATAKVLDDFKCATLSVSATITKPTRTLEQSSSLALLGPSSKSSSRAADEPHPSSKKRSGLPSKYAYFDISSEDEAVENDEDYTPSGLSGPSKPSDRRHSMMT